MCDMESIIIIHPSSSPEDPCEVVYEHVAARDLSVIRILIAAYLYTALPQDVYIDIKPRPNVLDTIIPSGAQINPDIPLSSDEEVFQSHSHHSDFDYYTITHDRQRALQFFRWKEWVKDNCSPAIATSGDVIKFGADVAKNDDLHMVAIEVAAEWVHNVDFLRQGMSIDGNKTQSNGHTADNFLFL